MGFTQGGGGSSRVQLNLLKKIENREQRNTFLLSHESRRIVKSAKKEMEMRKIEKHAHKEADFGLGDRHHIMGFLCDFSKNASTHYRRLSRDKERSRCLDLSFLASLFSSRRLLSLLRYL